jgi:hypothetical protein
MVLRLPCNWIFYAICCVLSLLFTLIAVVGLAVTVSTWSEFNNYKITTVEVHQGAIFNCNLVPGSVERGTYPAWRVKVNLNCTPGPFARPTFLSDFLAISAPYQESLPNSTHQGVALLQYPRGSCQSAFMPIVDDPYIWVYVDNNDDLNISISITLDRDCQGLGKPGRMIYLDTTEFTNVKDYYRMLWLVSLFLGALFMVNFVCCMILTISGSLGCFVTSDVNST